MVSLLPSPLPGNPYQSEDFLRQLLAKAVAAGARDIHLKPGQPPGARVRDDLVFFRLDRLLPEHTEACALHLIRDLAVREELHSLCEYDTSYEVAELGRFRVNIFRQRGALAIVMRAIPRQIPTFEQLGVPPVARALAEKERGLVLVVGAAGNGKSSTMAAMVGHLNATTQRHIITIEDPIEYAFADQRCSISQREVGLDTRGFPDALRSSLRQDPDVIMVGEIRDAETMDVAMKAAETGHLVLSTLHTPDVARTMHRVAALSGGSSQDSRERLSSALQGIIAQRLLPRADGRGMVLATECLVATGSVREAIRRPEGSPPLKELMETGEHPYGMHTFAMSLGRLAAEQLIDPRLIERNATF